MPGEEMFRTVVEIFVIPLGTFFLAWLIHVWLIHTRLNSPTELFVFLSSLDFVYLQKRDVSIPHINHYLAPLYSSVFGISLLVSLAFMFVAADTQGRIHEHFVHQNLRNRLRYYYPLGKVCLCWLVAIASITFHFVAIFVGLR
jgi:hypothetical protein